MGIIISKEHLKDLRPSETALCHGVFDVVHEGHLNYLEEAKKLARILVVSITTDRYVNKGPGRPYFNHNIRARMLAALRAVDYVIINDDPRATELIKELHPNFYVKGIEYKDDNDFTSGIKEEVDAVQSIGGEVVYIDKPTQSSSNIINTVFNQFTDHQNQWIKKIKSLGGMQKIIEVMDKVAEKTVTIVGEPIVDKYVYVKPEGISSKSPTLSSRFIREESFFGGSWAVQNHLAGFVKSTKLFAPDGNSYKGYQTPTKTRWIDVDSGQRIFEETRIDEKLWDSNDPGDLCADITESANDSDLLLLCDFGHGLFDGLGNFDIDTDIALNVQTNSSNFGFNPFTKHPVYEYLSIDLKEARVAFHNKNGSPGELFERIPYTNVSMTLGPDGSLFRKNREEFHCPAFADKVVDAIGAGDAYFAMTSILNLVDDCPLEFIPFIGNIFAGLKTKIIGNKHAVTKADLMKTLVAVLK